jgi:hypothetical protein
METATKQYNTKGWEYYLALTLAMIGALAVIAMALRTFGVL